MSHAPAVEVTNDEEGKTKTIGDRGRHWRSRRIREPCRKAMTEEMPTLPATTTSISQPAFQFVVETGHLRWRPSRAGVADDSDREWGEISIAWWNTCQSNRGTRFHDTFNVADGGVAMVRHESVRLDPCGSATLAPSRLGRPMQSTARPCESIQCSSPQPDPADLSSVRYVFNFFLRGP